MNLVAILVILIFGIGVPKADEPQRSLVDPTNNASLLYDTEEELQYVYSITPQEGASASLLGNDVDGDSLIGPDDGLDTLEGGSASEGY